VQGDEAISVDLVGNEIAVPRQVGARQWPERLLPNGTNMQGVTHLSDLDQFLQTDLHLRARLPPEIETTKQPSTSQPSTK